MQIQYIGKQPQHTDRIYETRVRWSGPGDVQEVPDEAAQRMLTDHPAVYARYLPTDDGPKEWDKEQLIEHLESVHGIKADRRRSRERLLQDLADLEG